MTRTIGIGVIGMGWMGEAHSRAYRSIQDRFSAAGIRPRLVVCADPVSYTHLYIAPDAIRWIRSSHLLLYGRLEIASAVQGQPVRLDIEFNAVGWRQKDQNWRNLVAQTVGMPPIEAGVAIVRSEQDRVLLQGTTEKFVDRLFR